MSAKSPSSSAPSADSVHADPASAAGQPMLPLDGVALETLAVRAGFERSSFGEHAEGISLSSSFVHDSAAHAAAKFAGEADGFIYSRFRNPTVSVFQERLAALEGAEACLATASGMSAIHAAIMSLTATGDHIVCSQSVFGTTIQLFALFERYGVRTTYVPLSSLDAWEAAIRPETRVFFAETPANPTTELVDLRALAELAHRRGILLIVDNCFCTPVQQQPLKLGADIVVHSATKFLDGQGRVLGGAVLGKASYIKEKLEPIIRYTGPAMSAFNAWVLLGGLQTLPLRMAKHAENALAVAQWLEKHPAVSKVYYPGLSSHPQHALARSQQSGFGAVLSFDVKGSNAEEARRNAWNVIDNCRVISITANLGDVKSTITHPATTTHGKMSLEARAVAGIGDGMVRLAVGLEAPVDLCADLARGLSLVNGC